MRAPLFVALVCALMWSLAGLYLAVLVADPQLLPFMALAAAAPLGGYGIGWLAVVGLQWVRRRRRRTLALAILAATGVDDPRTRWCDRCQSRQPYAAGRFLPHNNPHNGWSCKAGRS